MKDVRRFRFVHDHMADCYCDMEESPPGDRLLYVEATDYDALAAELARREAELLTVRGQLEKADDENDRLAQALRRISEWPDGGNQSGQANIQRFALAALAGATANETGGLA